MKLKLREQRSQTSFSYVKRVPCLPSALCVVFFHLDFIELSCMCSCYLLWKINSEIQPRYHFLNLCHYCSFKNILKFYCIKRFRFCQLHALCIYLYNKSELICINTVSDIKKPLHKVRFWKLSFLSSHTGNLLLNNLFIIKTRLAIDLFKQCFRLN